MSSFPCLSLCAHYHPWLIVTFLHLLQENDVRQLFAPFGSISSIEIVKDAGGQSQGYGYVEFTSMPDASKAMQQWDGQEVVGQKLSVKIAPLAPGQAQTFAMPQLDLDDDEGQYNIACARLAFLLKKACPQ